MTPPATAAARPRSGGAQRVAVRHPRRVSGPARPGGATATPRPAVLAAAVALPAPALPRRARTRAAPATPRRGRAQQAPGLALRAWGALDRASNSALVERLIRGRVWIGVLAFALIGIVAMQLLVLKLNNDIGRTLQRQVVLERQNAQLGIEGSEASAGDLVEPQAAAAGMTFAAPGALRFLAVGPSDVQRAAAALSVPIQPAPSGVVGAPPAGGAVPSSTSGAAPSSTSGAVPSSAGEAAPSSTSGLSPSSESTASSAPTGG